MTQHKIHMALLSFFTCAAFATTPGVHADDIIRVGSKNFTEQEILGEMVAQLIERHTNLKVKRRLGLGGTGVCHGAIVEGELDIYVEYTGTALLSILKNSDIGDPDTAFRRVARQYRDEFELEWLPPIGFNNTYVIAVRADDADSNQWNAISDLRSVSHQLKAAFPSEFMERPDGYKGFQKAYGFDFASAADLDPGLMYKALADGAVDVISAFATDGRIVTHGLKTLRDDRGFFPPYDAAPVVRAELLLRHPEIRDALVALAGTIDEESMRALNSSANQLKKSPTTIAREWIEARSPTHANEAVARTSRQTQSDTGIWNMLVRRRAELGRKTIEHLGLTTTAIFIAITIGVPIGILIHRFGRSAPIVLAATEIIQTIPSLAMLAFLFALYRVLGTTPAITALVLYALLPITLNTYTGLKGVSPAIVEAANGLGMSRGQRLRMVELPLALPVIVAGIRTATVWTVGIATLSTYIGAGGLGDFISRGLARNDTRLTLLGAVPAAIMAVILSLMIRVLERYARAHRPGAAR